MLDIETKGTSKRAVVLSVGAVAFTDYGFLNEYPKTEPAVFYGQVPWDDPTQSDRVVDDATMQWWDGQYEAKRILQAPDSAQRKWVYPDLRSLLLALSEFVVAEKNDAGRIISKGIDFDVGILSEAYYEHKLPVPWKFWHTRCMRGWMDACVAFGLSPHLAMGIYGGNPGLKHHAADDAVWQTMIYVRYNHQIWRERHKNAQTQLDLDGGPNLMAAP